MGTNSSQHSVLTDEQVAMLADLAAALTPLPDAATLMGVAEADLRMAVEDEGDAAHAAYHRSKQQVLLDIRRTELKMARAGSPLAMQLVKEYVNQMEAAE